MSYNQDSRGAQYKDVGASYFQKRTLKRSAGTWGIWGLGVAAVISVSSRAGTSEQPPPASAEWRSQF